MKRTPLARVSPTKKKVVKTKRAKKMELKRQIIEQYNLPNVPCSRYGLGKNPTRQDILKGILWHLFSRFIRERDQGVCITCWLLKSYEEVQAGHYISAGGNDLELLFHEKNVNGECNYDNAFNSDHIISMRKHLIAKWGCQAIEDLEQLAEQKRAIKWEEETYVSKILYYHAKIST